MVEREWGGGVGWARSMPLKEQSQLVVLTSRRIRVGQSAFQGSVQFFFSLSFRFMQYAPKKEKASNWSSGGYLCMRAGCRGKRSYSVVARHRGRLESTSKRIKFGR